MPSRFFHLFYNFFIKTALAVAFFGRIFSKKINDWYKFSANFAEKGTLKTTLAAELDSKIRPKNRKIIWMHCASLGEFEQGRSVLEAFRQARPDWIIVLTFFSPSGFEIRKNWSGADWIGYLPADSAGNARRFQDWMQPDLAVFVKYEFWANHLFELQKRAVPTFLISAIFRPQQPFFHFFGIFWRKMLGCFTHFFVQNEASSALLKSIGFENITIAGDTRIDRVLRISAEARDISAVDLFLENKKGVLICGSTWATDERVLGAFLQQKSAADFPQKVVVAPHVIGEKRIEQLQEMWPISSVKFSEIEKIFYKNEANSLIINNIGMLSSIYRYGRVAYIGGGFGAGIHNTLEPAAFGLPVIFGPRFEKFEEARNLVSAGGFFVVRDEMELATILKQLENEDFYAKTSGLVRQFLDENKGATDQILAALTRF